MELTLHIRTNILGIVVLSLLYIRNNNSHARRPQKFTCHLSARFQKIDW